MLQEVDGRRQPIAGRYVVTGRRRVGFTVAAYDRSRPLIIDPVLIYSTYLGGSVSDVGNAIAGDAAGSAYVTGFTASPDFPKTTGVIQTASTGIPDAFVTKMTPNGSGLVYSTYLGGTGYDEGLGIAVDVAGNAYVMGAAQLQFPTTPGAFRTSLNNGGNDTFVAKLDSTGSTLLYSTFLDGKVGAGIAVNGAGNAYVTGSTGPPYPVGFIPVSTTVGALQTVFGGFQDAFVMELDVSGSGLTYFTYFGGSSNDAGTAIAVDGPGNAYITGFTISTDFPTTTGAFQTTRRGMGDTFVAKLNPGGAGAADLVYSTYLGGSSDDRGMGIAVDAAGNAYVTGYAFTPPADFPTTAGAFQPTPLGPFENAFVTKLNSSGSGLTYSTYLGGNGQTAGFGIGVDGAEHAYVTGFTNATNFPTTVGAFQVMHGGNSDAFVTELNSSGSGVVYSTFVGGSDYDLGNGLAVDTAGRAYVTGLMDSSNLQTTPGAFRPTAGGAFGFVAQFGDEFDQQQPTIDQTKGGLAIGGASQQIVAQTVTAGAAGQLSEVRLPVACTANADLILSIQGVTATGEPNGVVLATRTFAGATLPAFAPAPAAFRGFALATPIQLTAGTRYAIVLSSTGLTASANCASFQGPIGDPYSGGNMYFDARPNAPGWVCQCTFINTPYDLPFQTVR